MQRKEGSGARLPSARAIGSYVLVLRLGAPQMIEIGALGNISFRSGYYAYVGSALGGLKPRLQRHVSKKKTPRWHADYITSHASLEAVLVIEGARRIECAMAGTLGRHFDCIAHFGCGDCECISHLFFSPSREDMDVCLRSLGASFETRVWLLTPKELRRYLGLKGR